MPTDEGRNIEDWTKDGKRIVIRTARWADLDGYAAMHRALHQERVMAGTYDADTRLGGELLSKRLILAATGAGILLLIEADGQIGGEGFLTPSNGDGSITLGIAIRKEYRNLGIGRRLMLALEGEARRLGKRRIDLTVWAVNPAARHLYTSVGYREMGRFPNWIRSDLAPGGVSDHVWMIKDLG
jgi:ribosomal protein S18 acetylase RimI-like enzyme